MSNVTVYRKDYQPCAFVIETVELCFDLYDDYALINNRMRLKRQYQGALVLNGEELVLRAIYLDGHLLTEKDYLVADGQLTIASCPDEFSLQIETQIKPQENTKLSGLYRSNQLFCTQCEAEGFRRMTYFLDRPDVLTSYTTRICADKSKYPVLLSNGNLMGHGTEDNGRHWVLWHDPFKKPSYLFALVAGTLALVQDTFITHSGRSIDLRIYVEPGNEDKCDHAMRSLKNAMRWDEVEYGREYDLDIFMIVAVSDFNMGAMENKGLNLFNSKYILARPDTATDQDYADIEGVVAHEYFHNWTGNRVTCRDWFQLSLKEGLTVFRDQEFSRDMNSRDVNRILDVKALQNTQFPEDAGAMAHPVRPDSYQEINNFYTATIYNKGAEVIRMQQTLLGKAGFRRGMDLYFARHDGQAVTIDDFVAAMQDANHIDLTQFKRWYSQAGTPVVTVASTFQDGVLSLQLTQACRATPECAEKQPFHIPIRMALFAENGQPIPVQAPLIELREAVQTVTFTGLQAKPVVSLLREFSAPIMLHDDLSDVERLVLLRYETDGYAKWRAAQTLAESSILQGYQNAAAVCPVSPWLLDALTHVLQADTLDAALRAELITPPSFEELAAQMTLVDVGRLEGLRDNYRTQLSCGLQSLAQEIYAALWHEEHYVADNRAYGQRRLRNLCLWLMMKADETAALSICQTQFNKANTMTDQLASFSLLVNASAMAVRAQAIEQFYQQWQHDELVLDKWFSLQAMCEAPDTLQQVVRLLSHPAFQLKNPNKVRALIGAFCQANPRHFHAADGSGYAFLTDMLLKVDAINPQIAARLATPLTRWQRLDQPRQALIQQQLAYLIKRPLSRDLQEIVTKSIA